MLVARRRGRPRLQHARFLDLPSQLAPGDLLVVNTSATLPAALPARRAGGEALDLHLSTPLPGADPDSTPLRYIVELRRDRRPLRDVAAGERLVLPRGASAELVSPYLGARRLWVAELRLPRGLSAYLGEHGRPISYGYLRSERPLSDYQTIFATEPGSAEMPSAGRPFTPRVLAALIARGVAIAPITLHTGVSSLERGERPYPEWFRVPAATARLVNATRSFGGRVIAVGTTVVRALESAVCRGRCARRARGLDESHHHLREPCSRAGRPRDRLARPRRIPPGHAGGDRGPAPDRGPVRERGPPWLPLA